MAVNMRNCVKHSAFLEVWGRRKKFNVISISNLALYLERHLGVAQATKANHAPFTGTTAAQSERHCQGDFAKAL